MSAKQIIAVDIDDVIYPLVPDLIDYLDKNHKVKLTKDEFVKYDIREVWQGGPIEAEKIFNGYKERSAIEVAPLKGAKDVLHKLAFKYDVIVMTARDITVEQKTKEWIYHHFPEIFKEVHLLGNRRESVIFRSKAEVCKQLGVYCLIDDRLQTALEVNKAGIKAILFGDYPWNRTNELPDGITRLKNWQEVLEYFDEQSR